MSLSRRKNPNEFVERAIPDRKMLRYRSPDRVLEGAESSEAVIFELSSPRLSENWRTNISASFKNWETWELPIKGERYFWEKVNWENFVMDSPSMTKSHLLSVLGTFPNSYKVYQATSLQFHSLSLWNTWSSIHASTEEKMSLEKFYKQLTFENVERKEAASALFPRRLERKYPGRAKVFINSISSMKSELSSRDWLKFYLQSFTHQTKNIPIGKMDEKLSLPGGSIAISSFLSSKVFTDNYLGWIGMALANVNASFYDKESALSLVTTASMYLSVYRDVYVRLRKGVKEVSSLKSTAEVYSFQNAVVLANMLLIRFEDEKEEFLRAHLKDDSDAASQFVNCVQSSVQGIVYWFKFSQQFQEEFQKSMEVSVPSSVLDEMVGNIKEAVASVSQQLLHTPQ